MERSQAHFSGWLEVCSRQQIKVNYWHHAWSDLQLEEHLVISDIRSQFPLRHAAVSAVP